MRFLTKTAPRSVGLKVGRSLASHGGEGDGKKKKKAKTGSASETSDGTDGGVCWSDYERTPGTTEGAEGSCQPKKKKKKKKSDSD